MIAVHLENHRIHIRREGRPRRPRGFALIRLLTAGICNTDLELQRGYYDFSGTPGHEFVGEVMAADNPKLIAHRVVGEINLACHRCDWCNRGLGRHCPNRSVLGIVKHPGAFREFLTLPEENLHVLAPSISNHAGVFVEPLAAACEILDQARIPKEAEVAVLGDGKLGLLVAQTLNAYGARVRLFGRHKEKLRIAERVGVHTEISPKRLPSSAFDWLVEATGSQEGLRQAIQMTRPRGTVFMKSTVHRPVPIDTAPVIVNEITLIGSRCGRFEPALSLIQAGRINLEGMVSAVLPLAHAQRAFQLAARRGVLKVILEAGTSAAVR
jgi:alcohol dehydrogenase